MIDLKKYNNYIFIGLIVGIVVQLLTQSYYSIAVITSGFFCGYIIKKYIHYRLKHIGG